MASWEDDGTERVKRKTRSTVRVAGGNESTKAERRNKSYPVVDIEYFVDGFKTMKSN